MTIIVKVSNENQGEMTGNIRVHKVHFNSGGTLAEDGVIIGPGCSCDFTIWGTTRLAIEEEYEVPNFAPKIDDANFGPVGI